MKKYVKYAMGVLALIIIACCIASYLFPLFFQPEITCESTIYNDSGSPKIIIGEPPVLWDTGNGETILFRDFAEKKYRVGLSLVFDFHREWRILCRYFSRKIYLDPFTIKNALYTMEKKEKLSPFIKNSGEAGILGMDVIGKANWLIDFSEKSIQSISHNDTVSFRQQSKFSLSYRKTKRPKTTLTIQDCEIKDILIDSGSDADMIMLETDIQQIKHNLSPTDSVDRTSSGLFSGSIPEKQYIFRNIVINGYRFDNLSITQSKTNRLIGMGFFRKFDKVYLNTEEKIFRFY
ncbi:MAG: hypothetical protein LBS55_12460 [Prevotellaceae bacterium]|jgi:hypothetical protein|nr:hypothetical protein [Prevotellaceae bacterium]